MALILTDYLRDYSQANTILKHLKKYCNTYNKLDLYKEVNALNEKEGQFSNNRDKGKFRVQTIIENYKKDKPHDVSTNIAEYVYEKLEIRSKSWLARS